MFHYSDKINDKTESGWVSGGGWVVGGGLISPVGDYDRELT